MRSCCEPSSQHWLAERIRHHFFRWDWRWWGPCWWWLWPCWWLWWLVVILVVVVVTILVVLGVVLSLWWSNLWYCRCRWYCHWWCWCKLKTQSNSDGDGHQESVVHIITETHRFGKPLLMWSLHCVLSPTPHLNWCFSSRKVWMSTRIVVL